MEGMSKKVEGCERVVGVDIVEVEALSWLLVAVVSVM